LFVGDSIQFIATPTKVWATTTVTVTMNGTHNDYHDSDIADLVDDNTNGNGGAGKTAILEMTPLNNSSNDSNSGRGSSNAARSGLEEAGLFKQPSRGGSSPPPPLSYGDFQLNCCSPLGTLLFVYICYTCEYAPRTCWTIGIVVLLISSYLLIVGVLANPTEHFGVIQHDFSNIQSQYDFHIKDIDHWCLQGDNDSCQCQDPLQPTPRNDLRIWTNTHGGNVETVNKMVENGMGSPDIAFLGGTIVEAMDGKWFGNRDNPRLMDIGKIFDSYFISNVDDDDDEDDDDDDDDASTDEDKLTAVSLGIAGDTVRMTGIWEYILCAALLRSYIRTHVTNIRCRVPFFWLTYHLYRIHPFCGVSFMEKCQKTSIRKSGGSNWA
jgi:hypothetical protein